MSTVQCITHREIVPKVQNLGEGDIYGPVLRVACQEDLWGLLGYSFGLEAMISIVLNAVITLQLHQCCPGSMKTSLLHTACK